VNKKRIHIILPLLFVSMALLYSCVKEQSYQGGAYAQDETFFRRNSSLNGFNKKINGELTDEYSLNKIIGEFKNLDRQQRIVEGIKKQHGLPLWDLSVLLKNDNGYKTVITPLKYSNSDTTEALLISYIENGKTKFKIIDAKAKHPRLAKQGAADAKAFTLSTVQGLFKACNESIKRSAAYSAGSRSPNNVIINWMCWNYYATYTDPATGVVTGWASTVQCSYTITITPGDLQYLDPSYYNDPTGGGGGGSYVEEWTYVTLPNPNQGIIDSLNGYPCAQGILAQMPNLDSNTRAILNNVFGVNDDVNLRFSIDPDLGRNGDDGYTRFPGGSPFNYNAILLLNPWVLQNSTREFIFATMLHESIHANIYYHQMLYSTGQIDSNQFKAMFPIFWNYRQVLHNPVDIAQHNQIADNYINAMVNALKAFNPQITDSAANALAWGGLYETTRWATKSDTPFIKDFNATNARNVSLNQYSQFQLTKCN
jgi:hypothetical protein